MKRTTLNWVLVAGLFTCSKMALSNEYTDVIDAFDDDNNDPFDIQLTVGYERFQRNSAIRRESLTADPHSWDYYAYKDYFKFKQVTHILNINVDIGIYKDLAFRFRLPLVLNDTRELRSHGDWDKKWSDNLSLFPTPFKSPERSGVDYFAVGLWWGILAQERDETKPDWVLFAEGRFGVGDIMTASCRMSSDLPGYKSADVACTNKGGVSRGLNELAVGTRLSRRFGILDPYFGFEGLVGWPKDGTPFFTTGPSSAKINTMPPIVGTIDFGMEIIPWESQERHIKLAIDVGGTAKYHSEGREYSPLFDALGTSPYLLHEDATDFDGDGTNDLSNADASEYTGMTDVENYATFTGKLSFMIQPAKYVKFVIGTILGHESQHFVTKTDQCTSGNLAETTDSKTGDIITICQNPNSDHRPAIDSPGKRFRAEETFIWTFFVNASAMF